MKEFRNLSTWMVEVTAPDGSVGHGTVQVIAETEEDAVARVREYLPAGSGVGAVSKGQLVLAETKHTFDTILVVK
jgi:hypothetical protein